MEIYPLLSPIEAKARVALTFPAYQPLLGHETDGNRRVLACGPENQNNPGGLALAVVNIDDPSQGELLSVMVPKAYRLRGIGTSLVASAMHHAAEHGVTNFKCFYSAGIDGAKGLEAIFRRLGWPAPGIRGLSIKYSYEKFDENPPPWARVRPLRPEMELRRWHDLNPEQRDELVASNLEEHWIPDDLNPFDFDLREPFDQATSFVLLVNGKIRAWVLTHALSPKLLRFTNCYVHPSLHSSGRLLNLKVHVVNVMRTLGFSEGICTVSILHPPMYAFMLKYVAPYSLYTRELRECITQLEQPAGAK